MDNLGIILSAIFVPISVTSIFFIIRKFNNKTNYVTNDENFVVMIPKAVAIIGILCALMSVMILLGFTIFSQELPHIIFYIVFGSFYWLGIYLILKTVSFKVIVKDKKITVYYLFRKPYFFTFNEIVSVVRQVKKNQTKSERIIITTVTGKRLIIENIEISYKRFIRKIESEVDSKYLFGWTD